MTISYALTVLKFCLSAVLLQTCGIKKRSRHFSKHKNTIRNQIRKDAARGPPPGLRIYTRAGNAALALPFSSSSLLPPLWFDSNRDARGIRFCSVLLGAVVAEIIEYMREREVIPTFAAESFPGEEGLMENLYGPNSRLARMRALLGNFPEINTRRMDSNLLQGRGRQRHFQMNQNIDTYSPIVKFLLSKSPSSAVENNDSISPVMVNMEEDTLVVDGVLLKSVSGGPSSGNSRHKRSTYRAGEENCLFSYGSKRHHVHGKEEQALRFSPFAMKASPEASRTVLTRVEMATNATPRPGQIHNSSSRTMSLLDWSPHDDGIQIILPSHPGVLTSREDVDTYIQHFLYGQSHTRKRLPVFTEICSP